MIINSRYLAKTCSYPLSRKNAAMISLSSQASVGRKISGADDRRRTGYRREWQGAIRSKRVDIGIVKHSLTLLMIASIAVNNTSK